jgi:hypothetical protein
MPIDLHIKSREMGADGHIALRPSPQCYEGDAGEWLQLPMTSLKLELLPHPKATTVHITCIAYNLEALHRAAELASLQVINLGLICPRCKQKMEQETFEIGEYRDRPDKVWTCGCGLEEEESL